MYIYIIMLIISFIILDVEKKINNKKIKKVVQILSLLPFLFISAVRYDVGTDYFYRYVPSYNLILRGNDVASLESLFKLIIKACIFIAQEEYQVLFMITSFVIFISIGVFISDNSKNIKFSILILFLSGMFFASMNIVRQYMAIAVLLLGYKFLINKQYLKWSIFCIIAILLHNASVVVILYILLNRKKEINAGLIIGVSLYIVLFGTQLHQILEKILGFTRFSAYIQTSYYTESFLVFTYLKYLFIYLFVYYMFLVKKKKDKIEQGDIFLVNVQGVAILCYSMTVLMQLFSRTTDYFMIFQIISIPNFIEISDKKENKILYKISVIIMYLIFFYYTNIYNNYNEVLPYTFFWERN